MNVYTGDQAKLTLQVAEWCHFLGMFGDHLAVEHAVVHAADEHQVVGIIGELGRADRISARTVGESATM